MTDGAEQPRAAGPALAVVLTGLLVALVLLLATWAASTGPDDPFPGEGAQPDRISTTAPSETPTAADTGPPGQREREEDGSWASVVVGVLVLTVGVGLVLLLLWVGIGHLLRLRRVRREPWRAEPDVEPPPLEPVEAIATALLADADEQLALLTSGSPRNAVVACWHHLEVRAERAGLPREPWETSAEFTLRLLDLVEADAHAVARLADLYREARFSEHEIGEDARAAAVQALETVHRDLRTLLSRGRV